MAKRIYTYRLMKRDRQVLPLPIDAQILCVQEQFGEAHVSVMLEADELAKYKPRTIVVLRTGQVIAQKYEGKLRYIGSIKMGKQLTLWHVFEEVENNDQRPNK